MASSATIYNKRKKFVVLQAVVFAISLCMSYAIDLSKESGFILLYSLFNVISYGWLFVQEMRYAPDFHPYQVLALVSMQFIGLNGISLYEDLVNNRDIYLGNSRIDEYLYLGMLFLSFQHLVLYAVFFLMEKRHATEHKRMFADRIKHSKINYWRWAKTSYLIIWTLRVLSLYIPFASISSIVVNIINYGHLLTLYLIIFAMIKSPKNGMYKTIHWAIVLIEIALVLNHGMKEEIIRTLVPYCIYLIIMFKNGYQRLNAKLVTIFALIGFVVVGFVFPYVSITRSISLRTGKLWNEIPTEKVFDEYLRYLNGEDSYANDDEERGIGYMMNRAGSISCNAWSVNHAREEGIEPMYLAYCLSANIPRMLWPNKPDVVTGVIAYAMVNGESNWINAKREHVQSTSISLGFIGSCYICLGFFGSIIYLIFISWFIWLLWDTCRKKMTYNIVMLWAFISLITILLKDFENFADCGINFIIFNTIYILICKFVDKKRIITT